MVELAALTDRFRWQLLVWAALGAIILFVALVTEMFDFGPIVYFLFAAIAILGALALAIVLAIGGAYRRALSLAVMIAAIVATSFVLFENDFAIHTWGHWFTQGARYRAAALAQADTPTGELKHVEWDGWGWGGNDITVYLVFDPTDSLVAAAKNHASGRISDALCGVSRLQRLDKKWYSVVFYTNEAWGHCD